MEGNMEKKSRGRQRIKMAKMENKSNLQITFSKRRSGLFKKASELNTLCGADIAVIVFSPGGKVYSFGHPNVEIMVNRFKHINHPFPNPNNNMRLSEVKPHTLIQLMNDFLTQVMDDLETSKKKNEEISGKIPEIGYINPNLDQSEQRRMFNVSTCYNQNMYPPIYQLPHGNNSYAGGYVPDQYNLNCMRAINQYQNQIQNQNMGFRDEGISDNERHQDGHPPYF
ncbi:unnamed protein product [Eruca vesicaria subsp. sativa]|uniref:MADS-box domain-containing protein n=1 Tax=Eruca vesicaria subsp. sativa TaxID=29727 RepID=A0ABC8KG30_ERUVS|nr:unnamed protein product [Eruca vesicaria subsp. sativa]